LYDVFLSAVSMRLTTGVLVLQERAAAGDPDAQAKVRALAALLESSGPAPTSATA
jgi:hypothetical protein